VNPRQPRLFNDPKEAMTEQTRTENDSALQFATERAKPETLTLKRGTADEAQVIALQKGQELHSVKKLLDAYLPKPERREGTTVLSDPDSFVAFVKRNANPDTVIYVDVSGPSFVAVFDHDAAGPDGAESARWGRHRATYAAELSDEWEAWTRRENGQLSQGDFADFIEARALDLLDPTEAGEHPAKDLAARLALELAEPAKVIAASRGLKLRAEVNVTEAVTLESGETELHFAEKHVGTDGQQVKVPSAFLVGIPVLKGAPRDVLLARLRYRRAQGQPRVTWAVSLHRPEDVMRAAVDEVVAIVREGTGAVVLKGSPAPAR